MITYCDHMNCTADYIKNVIYKKDISNVSNRIGTGDLNGKYGKKTPVIVRIY